VFTDKKRKEKETHHCKTNTQFASLGIENVRRICKETL